MIMEPLGSELHIPISLSLWLPICHLCYIRPATMVKDVPKARITQWHFSFGWLGGWFWPKAEYEDDPKISLVTELVVLSDAICYPDNSGALQVEVPVMPPGSCGFSS